MIEDKDKTPDRVLVEAVRDFIVNNSEKVQIFINLLYVIRHKDPEIDKLLTNLEEWRKSS
jgi:hypothetical protein